jgi:hypothetical protein
MKAFCVSKSKPQSRIHKLVKPEFKLLEVVGVADRSEVAAEERYLVVVEVEHCRKEVVAEGYQQIFVGAH